MEAAGFGETENADGEQREKGGNFRQLQERPTALEERVDHRENEGRGGNFAMEKDKTNLASTSFGFFFFCSTPIHQPIGQSVNL